MSNISMNDNNCTFSSLSSGSALSDARSERMESIESNAGISSKLNNENEYPARINQNQNDAQHRLTLISLLLLNSIERHNNFLNLDIKHARVLTQAISNLVRYGLR